MKEFLRRFRADRGITQGELATRLGFSHSYVAQVERGDKEPSRRFIQAFKREFPEIDLNVFFKESEKSEEEGVS